jgi:hypothetical protein
LASRSTTRFFAAISFQKAGWKWWLVLTDLIAADEDRIMIINLGPVDGRVEERIEFLGVHAAKSEQEGKIIIV